MVDLRVTTTGAKTVLNQAVVEELRGNLRGELIHPGDNRYDEARSIWNAMFDRRPALIVRCAGAFDVINCVNFARVNSIPVAVRGGGHNVSGSGACDGSLMLDMSRLKR